MIPSLLETMCIEFLDWDDVLIGLLVLPKHIRGYPKPSKEEYAAMRDRAVADFKAAHPRQRYIVVERHTPRIRSGDIYVEVTLEAVAVDYVSQVRTGRSFRRREV